MAARKSCTHLTWGEAKAKCGQANPAIKKKSNPQKSSHGDALTAKLISKNGASQQELNQHRSLLRKAKRDEERAALALAKEMEERERERAEQVGKPHEQARVCMQAMAMERLNASITSDQTNAQVMDLVDMKKCAECKQMQLDEILAQEAIFLDSDDFLLPNISNVEKLRELVEEYQVDESNEQLLQSIVEHPPLSMYFPRIINHITNPNLEASLLLHITYPQFYPLGNSTPQIEIAYFMITDRTVVCSPDKPLESLAYLDEAKLKDAFEAESLQILPDPSVYEVAITWLSENLFEFVTMHPHTSLGIKSNSYDGLV